MLIVNKGSVLHTMGLYSMMPSECIMIWQLKIDKQCAMAFAYKGLSLGEKGEKLNRCS